MLRPGGVLELILSKLESLYRCRQFSDDLVPFLCLRHGEAGRIHSNEPAMHRVVRTALFLALSVVACGSAVEAQQASASPAKSVSAPTPIPLAKVPSEAQPALASLQEIETAVSGHDSNADSSGRTLSDLTSEIDIKIGEDTRLLTASPSLDLLYPLKRVWRIFGIRLSVLARELRKDATDLEEQLERLDKLNKTWQATLQSAKQPEKPPQFSQSVQRVVDSVERVQKAAESAQAHVLLVQNRISEQETRVRTTLSAIEQGETRALKSLFVRDSPPIWSLKSSLDTEWEKHSGASFSAQLRESATFIKRLPFTFLIHALFIVLIASVLRWMRHRIHKLAEEKPDLQSALAALDLPISTACALSLLLIPSIYTQAPRLIYGVMAVVTIIPTMVILRRLLDRSSYPILNALVIIYFVGLLRVLAASLPVSARLIFLGQVLGAAVFLFWVLRSWHPSTEAVETHRRIWRTTRAVAKIGLVVLPVAFLANIFGYVNLGNLLGIIFFRSVFIAAMLYTAIRIIEGLMTIALHVQPLRSLRVISLHRSMLQRRMGRVFEFLAFLIWLNLALNFLGLRGPLIATAEAALNADLVIGSFKITPASVLAALITVWASFLVSKFLRFLLEEDVYHHVHLASGIPYAISTMLHYVILLLGFFIALGALGIDLTKLTILVGAFSVGIGFGLQNVINNFVSGLILLFERPIKIGDVVEVSGNVGEVRRIGIRASVIRTADGSEIIVPNGTLISSLVTNWTFSDRQRAIEVSVNVVAGADSERVVELLKNTAASQPAIVKEPAPQVYVLNFTGGAVTFQIRAWTDRYEDWARIRSDLAVAVKGALTREKIGIA
jgi:potassium efflux system protein